MKRFYLFSLALFFTTFFYGQNTPVGYGGGMFEPEKTEDNCLSPEHRAEIQMRLRISANKLMEEGKLTFSGDREDVKFIWPLQKADGFGWNSYYGVSNYVDQNTADDALGDYHCDERTYDGHFGTDIFTWPFPWHMYANDLVEIIAGEEGVIIEKDDGFEDDHCECYGSWNAVYVQHADGSVAWYGHMKSGSLTDKEVGESVSEGEFLGVVASSGCSTGPHLHLEVYDADVNLIDPYAGDCNDLNVDSWWEEQPENREPTLNAALTHDAVPEHGCPEVNEDPHFQNDFYLGDVLYTAFYFHDALAGSEANYKLLKPDGSVWQEWSHTSPSTYNASWWWWSWTLPDAGPFGVWTLEAEYNGETIEHEFNYGVYASISEEDNAGISIMPNPSNSGFISINSPMSETPVEIYDATGKMIKSTILTEPQFNVSDLAEGIYYFRFLVGEGIVTKKVMIIQN